MMAEAKCKRENSVNKTNEPGWAWVSPQNASLTCGNLSRVPRLAPETQDLPLWEITGSCSTLWSFVALSHSSHRRLPQHVNTFPGPGPGRAIRLLLPELRGSPPWSGGLVLLSVMLGTSPSLERTVTVPLRNVKAHSLDNRLGQPVSEVLILASHKKLQFAPGREDLPTIP